MKTFVRMTKLNNVMGRVDYITDPKRQEEIVASYESLCMDAVSWHDIAQYERSHRKSESRNNEARELIIALPNNLVQLPPDQMTEFISDLVYEAVPEVDMHTTPMNAAIHWNHDRTNLHMHLIFSERSYTGQVKYWDRDVYQTQDGRVARSKKERAVDSQGNYLPPIHRKGDIQSDGYSAKNPVFKTRSFTRTVSRRLESFFAKYRWISLEKKEPWHIHERHQGKNPKAALTKELNSRIKDFNADLDLLVDRNLMSPEKAIELKERGLSQLRNREPPRIELEWFSSIRYRLMIASALESRRAEPVQVRSQERPRFHSDPITRSYGSDPRGW